MRMRFHCRPLLRLPPTVEARARLGLLPRPTKANDRFGPLRRSLLDQRRVDLLSESSDEQQAQTLPWILGEALPIVGNAESGHSFLWVEAERNRHRSSPFGEAVFQAVRNQLVDDQAERHCERSEERGVGNECVSTCRFGG